MADNPQITALEVEIDKARKGLDAHFSKLSNALGEMIAATARNEIRLRYVEEVLKGLAKYTIEKMEPEKPQDD